jgi:hypothetical protein
MHYLFRQAQHLQGNNKRVPDFSMQLGRVVLETPEGNPMIITAIKGVLKENNRNTGQKGKAYLFIFLRDKNFERGG